MLSTPVKPKKKPARNRTYLLPTLRVIHDYTHEHGYAPSFRELMSLLGIHSTSVAAYRLDKLEQCGWLKRPRKGAVRALGITQAGRTALGVDESHALLAQIRAEVTALQNEAEALKFPLPFGFKARLERLAELTQEA